MLYKIKDNIPYHVQEFLYDRFVDVATEYVVSRGYTTQTLSLKVILHHAKIIIIAMNDGNIE